MRRKGSLRYYLESRSTKELDAMLQYYLEGDRYKEYDYAIREILQILEHRERDYKISYQTRERIFRNFIKLSKNKPQK